MACYRLGDLVPDIHDSVFVAPEATVIGQAVLCKDASVWASAVIRADNEPIVVGEGSNIQECAVLHADPGSPLTIGKGVTVGHQAMLHGCTIEENCLIGIQAVILNNAVIGKNSLVGAGAIVTEGKVFPERSLILGAPAKVVRTLTDEQVADLQRSAQTYIKRAAWFKADLKPL